MNMSTGQSILTSQPISLPSGIASDTALSLSINAKFNSSGVGATAVISSQRYITISGAPLKIGDPIQQTFLDIYGYGAQNTGVGAQIEIIQSALTALVPLLGL